MIILLAWDIYWSNLYRPYFILKFDLIKFLIYILTLNDNKMRQKEKVY